MLARAIRTAVGLLAAITLAVVAGCGSGSSGSGSAAGDDSAGLKGTPIVVGALCSCTGPLGASLGKSNEVLHAWAKWTNAHGGVNGFPVKVITYDDGQNPTKGLSLAKKLVEQDKVVGIVGQMSLVSSAWAGYVQGRGIPVLGGQPVDTTFLTNPDFFTSGTTLPVLLLAEIRLAAAAGAKTVGVFYCSETPVCAQLPTLLTAFGAVAGLKVVDAKVSQSAPNYIAECASFKQQGVDTVFSGVNSDVVARIAQSCAQQGFKPRQVASSATTQKSWTTDPNLAGSLVGATNAVYTDPSVPGVKSFLDATAQYLPGLQESPQFSWPLLYPWAGGELFVKAATAARLTPTSTPSDLKRGLYALKDETLDGLAPPLTFTEGKPGFPTCYFAAQLKDGAFQATDGGKPACIDATTAKALQAAVSG
jgi:branched-chain amino acid transport system substrate-binding protein